MQIKSITYSKTALLLISCTFAYVFSFACYPLAMKQNKTKPKKGYAHSACKIHYKLEFKVMTYGFRMQSADASSLEKKA